MAGAALLFGNAKYRSPAFPTLVTPTTDIEHLGRRLRELDFDTFCVPDADRSTMTDLLAQFRDIIAELPPGEPVVLHFAGHGIQRAGETYLAPVDVGGSSSESILLSCIRLSEIMDLLCWRDDQQKLLTIDACRTNDVPGVVRGSGIDLAGDSAGRYDQVLETMVLYSTAPARSAADGADAGSSPFCRGLLRALNDPYRLPATLAAEVVGFVFDETLRMQRPWHTGTMCRLWPFVPGEGATQTVALTVQPSDTQRFSLSDEYIAVRGHLTHRMLATDTTGHRAVYFVLVEPEREEEFLEAIARGGALDWEDYGHVIGSCYGEEPTEKLREEFKRRFGFDI